MTWYQKIYTLLLFPAVMVFLTIDAYILIREYYPHDADLGQIQDQIVDEYTTNDFYRSDILFRAFGLYCAVGMLIYLISLI